MIIITKAMESRSKSVNKVSGLTSVCNSVTDSMDMNLSKLQEMVKEGILARYSPFGHKGSDTT